MCMSGDDDSTEPEVKLRRCSACGAPIRPGVKKCLHCGRRQRSRALVLGSAGLLVLAVVAVVAYLGLWQTEPPSQAPASAAGVIQLPLPEFAASESLPSEPIRPARVDVAAPVAAPPESAQRTPVAAAPDRRLYVQPEALNLRQGPGVDTSVITQVSRGQELDELARREKWVKVRVDDTDMVGWVHSTYVDPEPR